jgi:hypothetical protein
VKPPRASDYVFLTTDFYGNSLILNTKTWVDHILDEHPIMQGCEKLVELVVQKPYIIRTSSVSENGLVFISEEDAGPQRKAIRVVAKYADLMPEPEKGSSSGLISTAYPVDLVKYPNPRLGRIIYQRGG